MDPRIQIRTHTKNSWIRNTVSYKMFSSRSVLEALLKRGSRVIMACSDPGVATTEHTRLRHALSLWSNSPIPYGTYIRGAPVIDGTVRARDKESLDSHSL